MNFDLDKFVDGANAVNADGVGYDDVKFEGYLCSATDEDNLEHRVYFTVDKNGKAISSFRADMLYNLHFKIATKPPLKWYAVRHGDEWRTTCSSPGAYSLADLKRLYDEVIELPR